MVFAQVEFDVRCEWGEQGLLQLTPTSDVVIIVDVLSFSTSVEIATSRGALVFPYRWKDEARAAAYAASVRAELAGSQRSPSRYSLSPYSLANLPPGSRLVLPSPNGATLSLATGQTPTLAGCLRNARAVARAAQALGRRVAVIPAGERWREDGSLRPAFEDWLGAGAILSHLPGSLSPEARAALAAFREAYRDLPALLRQCSSGKELIQRGFEPDVALAAQLDASTGVPRLVDGAYTQ